MSRRRNGVLSRQPLLTVACMGIIRVIYREPGGGILFIPILVLASVSLLLSSSVLVAAFFFVSRKIHRTVSTGSHSSGGGIDDDDDDEGNLSLPFTTTTVVGSLVDSLCLFT